MVVCNECRNATAPYGRGIRFGALVLALGWLAAVPRDMGRWRSWLSHLSNTASVEVHRRSSVRTWADSFLSKLFPPLQHNSVKIIGLHRKIECMPVSQTLTSTDTDIYSRRTPFCL